MTKTKLRFPKKFMWGASVSAHQVEGKNNNQWSVWELENAKSLAAQASYQYDDLENWPLFAGQAKRPENYVSGLASGHLTHYEQDFDHLKKLNLNSFRFSIEWSRLEPEEGVWSIEAIEHYRKYFASLTKRNITPIVTLFHFSLPVWFAEKGGFANKSNIAFFTRFVEKVLDEFGRDMKWIITINEPEVYAGESYFFGHWPPAIRSKWQTFRVHQNLLTAHKRAAKIIHGKNRRFKVSMAYNIAHIYAGDNAKLSQTSAWLFEKFSLYTLWRSRKHIDFIGLNYYFSDRIYGYRIHNPNQHQSDLGWDMQPDNLQHVLEYLNETFHLPIIITENGLADATDQQRQWWLTRTIQAMHQAIDKDVELLGYMHWSLLDNFEWDKGRWPRFGLLAVDYATMERTPRPSALALARLIKRLEVGK